MSNPSLSPAETSVEEDERAAPAQADLPPRSRWLKSPHLELLILLVLTVVCYLALALVARAAATPPGGMSGMAIWAWIAGFFLLSTAIAVVAVIGGIGGGVLFTPVMLAFTPVDSVIVRGTGLIVAMFSGLIATGPFMRSGLANLRVCLLSSTAYALGAFVGAQGAVVLAARAGAAGDGFVRLSLGAVLAALFIFLVAGGRKIEWPRVDKIDRFTEKLQLRQPYYEPSIGKVVDYPVARAGWLFVSLIGVGLVAGFYGMGAGWAIVPAQNLVAALPLKVAAANSGVLQGLGCIAIWPYLHAGAIIPLFVAPWLVGQVLGGMLGAALLIRVRAAFVRLVILGFMVFSCYGLFTKGFTDIGLLTAPPFYVTALVFLAIWIVVIFALVRGKRAEAHTEETACTPTTSR